MMTRTILTGFAILTLLISFSSGNFENIAFAEHDVRDDRQEHRDEVKTDRQEHRDTYREMAKAHKQEIKSDFKELKKDFKIRYDTLRDALKDELRDLKHARLSVAESDDSDGSEINEDDILAFEDKRRQLEELKREFREQIRDLKTQARQDIAQLKQDYIKHETDRRDKVSDKLSDLRLKYKDRIQEHRTDFVRDSIADFRTNTDRQALICHVPSDDAENVQTIRVTVNEVPAHLHHGDTMGECHDAVIDDVIDEIAHEESDKLEANDAIADAKDEIEQAITKIDEAQNDGKDTSASNDLITKAKLLLEEAEIAFDLGNFDEAEELADDAEDLASDARMKYLGKSIDDLHEDELKHDDDTNDDDTTNEVDQLQ